MAPTADELKGMADPHVQYEVDEFRASFDALKTLNDAKPEWNRTLESALLSLPCPTWIFLQRRASEWRCVRFPLRRQVAAHSV